MVERVIMQAREYARDHYNENDYVGDDGLLYCGKCDTPKECSIEFRGREIKVPCLCKCQEEERDFQEETERKQQEFDRINRLRESCIMDTSLKDCTFKDAIETPTLNACKRYANKWADMYKRNIGLLLHGDTGSGKTFGAACIANYLIDQSIPVLMTSFPRIMSTGSYDRTDILERFNKFPLLVIDDLGVERQSEYALEIVYLVVDERYKSNKPLIVTTNLSLAEMKNTTSIQHKRIYDRILEMCTPIHFDGGSMREKMYAKKINSLK